MVIMNNDSTSIEEARFIDLEQRTCMIQKVIDDYYKNRNRKLAFLAATVIIILMNIVLL